MDGRSINRLKTRKNALSAMTVIVGSGAIFAAATMLVLPIAARAQAMGKVSVDSGPVAPEGIAPAPVAEAKETKVSEDVPATPAVEAKKAVLPAPEQTTEKLTEKQPAASPPPVSPTNVPAPTIAPQAFAPTAAPQIAPQTNAPPVTRQMLDVRIAGEGYFRVQSPKGLDGGVFYTRTGNFLVDAQGRITLGNDGLLIDPIITVPTNVTAIQFSADGVVTGNVAGDVDPVTFGQVELAKFAKPSELQHVQGTLFKEGAGSGGGQLVRPGSGGAGTLKQGELEAVDETLRLQSVAALTTTPKTVEPPAAAPVEETKPAKASIENEPIAPARNHAGSESTKSLLAGGDQTKITKDAASSGWYSQFRGLAQVIAAMAVVVGLIFILKGLAKKFVPGAKAAGGKGVIEVLARQPISKNQAIVLVRIGSQIVALNQGKEKSESVLVISDAGEIAKIIGQIEGKKAHSSQAGFTKLLANARVDLEDGAEPELASMAPENLDEQLEEMAAAKRQLMQLRQHVRTVRDRLPER